MSFDDVWAQHVSNAKAKKTIGTQLNQLDDGAGGFRRPSSSLKITPSLLRTRAGRAEQIATDFTKTDDDVMAKTGKAGKGLSGFKCASAFSEFQDNWCAQMKHVKRQLSETLPEGLRKTATNFESNEKAEKARYRQKRPDD